jgi:hypothetical protein
MTTHTFPISGKISLSARLGFGSLTVQASDGVTEATATVTPRADGGDVAERTAVELRGRTLTIRSPKPRGSVFDLPALAGRFTERDAVDIEVTVPSGTNLKISSFGTDVIVHGVVGSTDISGGSASTTLEDVDGDLRLRFGAGPVRTGRVRGTVVIKAGSADAEVLEAGGRLVMVGASGNLQVGTARGPVWMRAGTGSATVGCAFADVDLVSGSGGLSVGLPAGQSAQLDVTTGGGQLRSELPVEPTRPSATTTTTTTTTKPITIKARTGSGDIHLYRAVA